MLFPMKIFSSIALVFISLLVVASAQFMPKVADAGATTVLRSYSSSTLYQVQAQGYQKPFFVLVLKESNRFNQGYAYAKLLANESLSTWLVWQTGRDCCVFVICGGCIDCSDIGAVRS